MNWALSAFIGTLSAAVIWPQALPTTAVRAGRLLDPKSGQMFGAESAKSIESWVLEWASSQTIDLLAGR